MYMEISQANTLYSDLKQTKMSFFTKMKNSKAKHFLLGGLVIMGGGRT
jgi:hypothetical protein